jgi:hypothetical protein
MILKEIVGRGGISIVPVHYSHDNDKDAEWAAHERLRYAKDADWRREYELDFSALSGAPAYPAFRRETHVTSEVVFHDTRPLCLALDFNVSPMAAAICQINGGWLDIWDEIFIDPGTVENVATELRNRHPSHKAEVWVYGDASGSNRGQTARSSYDLLRIGMAGYPASLVLKVPAANPHVGDRVNAFNYRLKASDGAPGVRIHPRCVELIKDLMEVRLRPDGKQIEKVMKLDDPYHLRTHISDAVGYLIAREWPVVGEMAKVFKAKARPPLVYKTVLGAME